MIHVYFLPQSSAILSQAAALGLPPAASHARAWQLRIQLVQNGQEIP